MLKTIIARQKQHWKRELKRWKEMLFHREKISLISFFVLSKEQILLSDLQFYDPEFQCSDQLTIGQEQ